MGRRSRGKRQIQRQPFLMQYKEQAISFLLMNNYTPLEITGNYKNKQLTLLSQRKFALPRKMHFFIGTTKKFKNGPVLNLGLPLNKYIIKNQIHLLRQFL